MAHPNAPLDLVLKLSTSENRFCREQVAKNPNAPVNILEQLALDEVPDVRQSVASNPKTPIAVLLQLARDGYGGVRRCVAGNPKTPIEVLLKQLARDAATNSTVAARMSAREDEREIILDLLAEESTHPVEIILQRLAKNGGMKARRFLAERADIPNGQLEQLAQATESEVRKAVAQNLNTPVSCLEQLALAKEPEVRQAVAQNPNTSIDTLEQLASDKDASVRICVAETTNLSSLVLEKLAGDEIQIVREKAMLNPSLSKKSVERIICGNYVLEYLKLNPDFPSSNPDSVTTLLNHYAKSQPWLVSYIALCQPQIYQEILQEKSRSISWIERFAVSENLQTSPAILKRLAEDSNQLVRAAAKNSLQKITGK